jgi:D,D-heptose 1,7-bisphosphate phosphatase
MLIAILAGGKGSRFIKFAKKPKLLIKFKDYTLLDNFINQCKDFNIKKIFLFLGFGSDKIIQYLKNNKIKVNYFLESKPLGTGGALKIIENKKDKNILVIMGDVLANVNFKKFITFHKSKKSDITLFAHPNNHPYDSDLIATDENSRVIKFYSKNKKKNLYVRNLASAGIYLVKTRLLKLLKKNTFQDLSKNLIEKLINKKKYRIFAYHSREYVKDAGTPDRYFQVQRDIKLRLPFKRNLKNKMPAIFLDRDGVINKEKYNIYSNPCNFYPRTAEAIRKINKMNYLCIVITNQPAIAKGFVNEDFVKFTHAKMETLVGYEGAYFDDILYCPHHPEKGFKGELKKYKIKCFCRKPKLGLIKKAKKKFNIDLKKSYFIGNSLVDYNTAINAGIKPIIINNNLLSEEINQKKKFKDLFECINYLINKCIL